MIVAVWRLDGTTRSPGDDWDVAADKWRATLLWAANGYESAGPRIVSLDHGLGAVGEAWILVNDIEPGGSGRISWRRATPTEAALARAGRLR